MFEYWFDTEEPFHGTTSDFLEVLCQIAEHFDSQTAGKFTEALLDYQHEQLAFLRVIDWKFEHEWVDIKAGPDPWPRYEIKLHKHR